MSTMYYTDQDFERYMARSERRLKVQFYVWLVCSLIAQPCLWYELLNNLRWSDFSSWFLAACSFVALVCLVGLWYCYYSMRQERIRLQRERRAQQEEANALLDEIEAVRQAKLNQD